MKIGIQLFYKRFNDKNWTPVFTGVTDED